MKKILFIGGISLLLGLSSCLKEGKNEITQTLYTSSLNIITNEETGEVVVSPGLYYYDLTVSSLTGTVSSTNLIFNNTNMDFTTPEVTYKTSGSEIYFANPGGTVLTNMSLTLNNSQFVALNYLPKEYYETSYGYYINNSFAGDYTYNINPTFNPNTIKTVGRFFLGDNYRVNIYQADTFFRGKTTTTYPSQEGIDTFETTEITYRFILDMEKKTAVMVIYNAKFSNTNEPWKNAIIVEGLEYVITKDGVSITGENLVPYLAEGNSTTPFERFVFNNIDFHTTDDLYTQCELDFKVAGVFTGHFEGSYLKSYYLQENQ